MKRWLWILWSWGILAAVGAVAGAAGIPCEVRLLNGDRLNVAYLGQEEEVSLFESDWQTPPIRIHGKYIEAIDFGRKSSGVTGDRQIFFDREQWLRGRIMGMNKGQFEIHTAWQDLLLVDKDTVTKIISAIPAADILYQGAGGLKGGAPVFPQRLPLGESTLNLPRVEGSFGLRLVFQIPDLPIRDLSGFSLEGFPSVRNAGRQAERSLRFLFTENGVGVQQIGPFMIRGGRVVNQQDSFTLPVSRGKEVELKVEYDEPRNLTRIKMDDQLLFERDDNGLENTNAFSRPELLFFIKSALQNFYLTDLLMYRFRPTGAEQAPEIPRGREHVLFVNGDAFPAEWQGIDAEGNWLLKGEVMDQITPMEPVRIFAWKGGKDAGRSMRRKASHVEVQLAGGGGRFLVEFVQARGAEFVFRREGWQGEMAVPFSDIEQLRFNPYFR